MPRPTKITEETVKKLEFAFAHDFNISEACDHADISRETYYNHINSSEEFSDKMERAQSDLKRKAKIVVANAIEEGNIGQAQWFLERRAKEEYSLKQTVDMNVSNRDETVEKLEELFKCTPKNNGTT